MVGIGGTQRIVTVLMVDVVDSTAIAERLGPARSKFLFDEIVALMAREVERLDGTVAQLTGDGLLALFGAPIGHEDDPERAVRAALAIRDVVSAYGDDVREAYEVTIAVRVAVNTGPVALAETDVPDAERYNALGDTVNVAARLQSAVANGAIVVGPETARQVRDAFDLEALGEFALKGIARTVAAYGVTCERGPARVRALAPLVGRDRERSVLAGAFDTVLDGSGAILTVVGEPGIGKSRLLAEIRRDFGERVRFLEGRGSSYAESFPYWPVRDLLRDWLGIAADAPEARLRLELKSALADLAAPSDAYTLIAPLVGISPPGEIGAALRDLGTEAIQQRTFAAVRDVVRRLAERQPLALVIDDLQWADTATLDLLQDLLSLTEEMPLAVVLAYRAERERASWRLGDHARAQYPHRHCEIELRPLDGADSRAFAAALAEIALPREVVDLLADRSGGNPFFLEEALQDLIERRALQRRDGAWVLADGESAAIPAVVQGVLQARLDRLPPATREVVSIASAIGRGFGLPLLERRNANADHCDIWGMLDRAASVEGDGGLRLDRVRRRHGPAGRHGRCLRGRDRGGGAARHGRGGK